MTKHIQLQLEAIVSNDGTRCAAECPRFAEGRAGWQDACRWDDGYHVVTHSRHPACIAAEQAAASVPSCEGAWVVGDRVRHGFTGIVGRVMQVDDDQLFVQWPNRTEGWLPTRFASYTRVPSDDHLDGGARSLDASEALREARVQGMDEARRIIAECEGDHLDAWTAVDAAIEAVRKGER